jgi:thiol-disulfide isomerase/thioredoxin
MSGLLFLSSDDFSVVKGSKGDILCHGIPGFSLILFYSTQCVHCQTLIPIFKKLPGTIGGCQFGMINVSSNKTCVKMSKDTITPINYVPYIVLYIQGKPFMRYNGPHDGAEIKRFIIEIANNVQSKQQFTSENEKNEKNEKDDKKGIPDYSSGIPLCGQNNNVCYLQFDEAYESK